jgi:hypothetical protein
MNTDNFNRIISFVLQYGDRVTYCNMYNNNPHYQFHDFDLFLNPDIGQANINCDPLLSGFNEIVIRNNNESIIYYHIKINNNELIYDINDREAITNYFKFILEEINKKNIEGL